jgi:hypothetical protein
VSDKTYLPTLSLDDAGQNSNSDAEVSHLWAKEALRRRDEVRNGKVKTVSAEDTAVLVRRVLAGFAPSGE